MSATDPVNESTLEVVQFSCLSDNYGYLVRDPVTGATAAVDTPDATPIRQQLQTMGWKLTHVLNTHHHFDHTGGNRDLAKENADLVICGPESEKIPGRTVALNGGDELTFGSQRVVIIDVGGHTKGHIAYYFPDSQKVFVGDAVCYSSFDVSFLSFCSSSHDYVFALVNQVVFTGMRSHVRRNAGSVLGIFDSSS